MGTVTISNIAYTIYGDQTSAVNYLTASLAAAPTAFVAATATKQAAALVMASRMLDRQSWQGTPTGTPAIDSVLQWPRNNVVDDLGNPVSNGSIPDPILKGCYELAAMLLYDPSLQDQLNASKNIASFNDGPASVSYFRPQIAGRFPMVVQELIAPYLARAANAGGMTGTDTSGDSAADDSTNISQFIDVDSYSLTRGT